MAKSLNTVKVVRVADGKEWSYTAFGDARTNNVGHGFFAVASYQALDEIQKAGYPVCEEKNKSGWVDFVTECILEAKGIDLTGMLSDRGDLWVTKADRAAFKVFQNGVEYTPEQTPGALRKEAKQIENAALSEQKALAKAQALQFAQEQMAAKMIPVVADITLDNVKEEQILEAIKKFAAEKVPELKIRRDLALSFGTGNSKRLYEMVFPPVVAPVAAPIKNLFE